MCAPDRRPGDRHGLPNRPSGGSYAGQVVLPASSVTRAPADTSHAEAATLPLNGLTARLTLDLLDLSPGQTIAVTGAAGAFGGYMVQLAKADGLRVVADASPADEELVRALGADIVVPRGDTVAARAREVVPEGVDGRADGTLNGAPGRRQSATAAASEDGWSSSSESPLPTVRRCSFHQTGPPAAAHLIPLEQHMKKIGVGIIGASIGGWASISHVPALKTLPDYELRAISTSRQESAKIAAKEFDVPAAFDNHADLIADPGVDLVVVAVKVAHHHALVSAALEAGKMVYSEWPLGTGSDQAADLSARAKAAGVRTVIGLQSRFSPVVRHAHDLIADGYVGEVLGTTLVGSGIAWGPETDRAHAYFFDAATGATPLTASAMHALEAMNFALGDFADVSAKLVRGRKEVRLADEGITIPMTVADQVSIIGTLSGGAAVSVFYRGGFSRGDNLRWEINGTEGDLVLTAPGLNGNLQVADLTLKGGRGGDTTVTEITVPDQHFDPAPRTLTGPPQNIAQIYAFLAKDLREGTHTVPGFDHALARHRLVDVIERASRTGSTQTLS